MVFSSGPETPVPLALWPCAQPTEPPHQPTDPTSPGEIPLPLAERLLTEYTTPGDLVLDATPTPTASVLAQAAATHNRRLASLGTCDLLAAPLAEPIARLMVSTGTQVSGTTIAPDHLAVQTAARLLTPGGLLAVVLTRPYRHPGAYQDPVTRTVRLAQEAGLGYLQHVIALLAPIHRSQLTLPPRADLPLPVETCTPMVGVHWPAHADVLLFTSPAMTEPQTVTEVHR